MNKLSGLNLLAATVLVVSPVRAQIIGVTPGISYTTNSFVDSTSFNSLNRPGSVYISGVSPWNGSGVGLIQSDPTTGDFASGNLSASFAGNNYSLTLNDTLTQQSGNTGYVDLQCEFGINLQIGASGLPSQTPLFPVFQANGTLNTASSSVSVTGFIFYNDSSIAQTNTVNYNWTYSNPGNFSDIPVSGTPANGSMPALPANSDLYLIGYFDFHVAGGTLSMVTIPEVSSRLLVGLAGACGLLYRRLTIKYQDVA